MQHAISVTNTSHVKKLEDSGKVIIKQLEAFSEKLSEVTSFKKPRGIVFHDLKSATEIFSDIPLPAYTSRELIHINPLVEVWKDIFLSTVTSVTNRVVENYYSNLDLLDVSIIAAHELTHHAEFFRDDFEGDEENMWFEEGMCFYIPRKLMLTEKKFQEIAEVESLLIEEYQSEYGDYTLDHFGKCGGNNTNNDYAAAFYDYWRSTKVVKTLIEEYFDGSIPALINSYEKWDGQSLLHSYFIEELGISKTEAIRLWLCKQNHEEE